MVDLIMNNHKASRSIALFLSFWMSNIASDTSDGQELMCFAQPEGRSTPSDNNNNTNSDDSDKVTCIGIKTEGVEKRQSKQISEAEEHTAV